MTKAAGPQSADGIVGTDLLATDTTLTPQVTDQIEDLTGPQAPGAADVTQAVAPPDPR